MKNEYEIGIIGLGAMGRNLFLNMAEHGFSVIGLDKDQDKCIKTKAEALSLAETQTEATVDVVTFIKQLRKPRAVLLLVPAGVAVDAVLSEVVPLLSEGDIVIDAGNSHFKETNRREVELAKKEIHFFGTGVSGGEEGARHGPCLMPGGNKLAYERVRPIFEAIAAKVKGESCVAYLGPHSAGHYVKMVHNGIEYGLMQLIAECYALLKKAQKLSDDECAKVFQEWSKSSETNSYLLEITAQIFSKKDDLSDKRLIDMILDVARQKGTGKWTCQDAMDLQVPVPTIDAAVAMRDLSIFKDDRIKAHEALMAPDIYMGVHSTFHEQLQRAYHAACILTFAQGLVLLQKASEHYKYDLNLQSVAKIWRGGCIIRTALLESIALVYEASPQLSNLLLDAEIRDCIGKYQADLRVIVQTATAVGISAPGLMASLAYYDGVRSSWLPANLIQAQRDYFGAHRYERTDIPGSFHADWESL
jgi:6-phosphogluconate dehydrogenase